MQHHRLHDLQGKSRPRRHALYKVGDVAEDDGNYSFVPVEEIQADIPEFGDIESPDLAGRLAELKGKLTPVTSDLVTVDKDGNATFSHQH